MKYRGVAVCTPSIGNTVSFWDDLLLGNVMSLKYPVLFEYEPVISLEKVMNTIDIVDLFRNPMSRQPFEEL